MTYHISTGMTPFQALYGRLPPLIPTYKDGLSPVHEVDQQLITRDELLWQLKANLERSVNRMKEMADKKHRDISFDVDKRVLLKLHPYHQQTVFKRIHQKLASHFYGPYQILEKIGPVAYKLQLLDGRAFTRCFTCHYSNGTKTTGRMLKSHRLSYHHSTMKGWSY